jgi:hypothetical protein
LYSQYGKTEIAVAVPTSSKILTLSDLNGKSLVFVAKEVSNDQIMSIWKNSKPNAVYTLNDAVNYIKGGSAVAIVAGRHSLEARKDTLLRIFPNKLIENDVVALFALGSKDLHAEFSKALAVPPSSSSVAAKSGSSSNSKEQRIAKMLIQLNELKKELELLQKELK